MDVSIIIVHYNTPGLTRNCIESIYQKTHGVNFEIIVVDNASTIHDAGEIKYWFPKIILIKSGKNVGFAGGNNKGIAVASGKYILLLNSDIVLIENSVLAAFEYLETHSNVGAVSAKLVFPDGRHQSVAQRFPSIKYLLIELLRVQKFLPKQKAGKILLGSFFDHTSNANVDWVWGAFFMFRKELLKGMPGNILDDRYFMYVEDMQWCWDIKKMGYEIHFFAGTTVIHYMGGSSGHKNELMKANNEDFLKRNFSSMELKIIKMCKRLLE
jgi:GT2 family glycosyltransferase